MFWASLLAHREVAGVHIVYNGWDLNDDDRLDDDEFYDGLFSNYDENEDGHWDENEWDDANDAGFWDV